MGRLNPHWVEVFSERILSFIIDVIAEIKKMPDVPEKAINDFIDNYYLHRDEITHSFSESFLNDIKNNLISEKIEYNDKYFRVLEETKERLIACCLDFFIEEAHEVYEEGYTDNLEVNEEEYVREEYPSFFSCLLEFEQSPEKIEKIEKYLIRHLKPKWKAFITIWHAYKEHSIPRDEMFREAFHIFGERKFIHTFHSQPMVIKCVRLKIKKKKIERKKRKKTNDLS